MRSLVAIGSSCRIEPYTALVNDEVTLQERTVRACPKPFAGDVFTRLGFNTVRPI